MDDKKKEFICDNSDLIREWCWEKNEAIGLNPSKLLIGSNKKAWWKCKEGHSWYVLCKSSKKVWWKCKNCGYEWEAVISSRNRGNGCPACAKEKRKVKHGKEALS